LNIDTIINQIWLVGQKRKRNTIIINTVSSLLQICTLTNVKHTVVKKEHDTYCYCISELSTENSLALLNNGKQITSTEIKPGKKRHDQFTHGFPEDEHNQDEHMGSLKTNTNFHVNYLKSNQMFQIATINLFESKASKV